MLIRAMIAVAGHLGLLPRRLALRLARLERWGIFVVIGVLLVLPTIGNSLGIDLHIFSG